MSRRSSEPVHELLRSVKSNTSGVDPGVINQGLFYLSWLMDHRAEFECLVRDLLGVTAAAQVLWSGPRLICIAGDFTRYDVHAVRQRRRSIDLVCYRLFGNDLLGLETVAPVCCRAPVARRIRRDVAGPLGASGQGALVELAQTVDEAGLRWIPWRCRSSMAGAGGRWQCRSRTRPGGVTCALTMPTDRQCSL